MKRRCIPVAIAVVVSLCVTASAETARELVGQMFQTRRQSVELIAGGRLGEAAELITRQMTKIGELSTGGTQDETVQHLKLLQYGELAAQLDHVRDLQTAAASGAALAALRQKHIAELAECSKTVAGLVEGGGTALSQECGSAGRMLLQNARTAVRLGSDSTALSILSAGNALLEEASQGGTEDWQVQQSLFLGQLLEVYLTKYKSDRAGFMEGERQLIRSYRNRDWICRAAYFFPLETPGIVQEPGSLRLYEFDVVAESELRDNRVDPALAALYYRLGETAFHAGLYSEAARWFETYLARFPTHHMAGTAKQLLAAARDRTDAVLEPRPGALLEVASSSAGAGAPAALPAKSFTHTPEGGPAEVREPRAAPVAAVPVAPAGNWLPWGLGAAVVVVGLSVLLAVRVMRKAN